MRAYSAPVKTLAVVSWEAADTELWSRAISWEAADTELWSRATLHDTVKLAV